MQKVSAVSMQQGSAANPRGEPSLDKRPLFQARGGLQELGISKEKRQGTLEREREASTEGNTW